MAPAAFAQGIRSVTRRTTTLERQQPARQFFDAAGVNVTGNGNGSAANPAGQPPVATRQQPAFATRPPTVLPPISQRIQRPQIVQTRPTGSPTNSTVRPSHPVPAKTHAKP